MTIPSPAAITATINEYSYPNNSDTIPPIFIPINGPIVDASCIIPIAFGISSFLKYVEKSTVYSTHVPPVTPSANFPINKLPTDGNKNTTSHTANVIIRPSCTIIFFLVNISAKTPIGNLTIIEENPATERMIPIDDTGIFNSFA